MLSQAFKRAVVPPSRPANAAAKATRLVVCAGRWLKATNLIFSVTIQWRSRSNAEPNPKPSLKWFWRKTIIRGSVRMSQFGRGNYCCRSSRQL